MPQTSLIIFPPQQPTIRVRPWSRSTLALCSVTRNNAHAAVMAVAAIGLYCIVIDTQACPHAPVTFFLCVWKQRKLWCCTQALFAAEQASVLLVLAEDMAALHNSTHAP